MNVRSAVKKGRPLIGAVLAVIWSALAMPADAKCLPCKHRSAEAKAEFKREHPCPTTGKRSGSCRGYVIDHVDPLCHGGPDDPSNMQWQTTGEAKRKDRWEHSLCRR